MWQGWGWGCVIAQYHLTPGKEAGFLCPEYIPIPTHPISLSRSLMWENSFKKKISSLFVRMATGGHCCEHKSGNSRVAFLQPPSRLNPQDMVLLEYVTAGILTYFQLAMRIIRHFGAAWWESSRCHLSASMTFRISCTMEKGTFLWHCEVIFP